MIKTGPIPKSLCNLFTFKKIIPFSCKLSKRCGSVSPTCIFESYQFKGCEIDVEMTDQSYHQKTEIENVSDETKSDTEV